MANNIQLKTLITGVDELSPVLRGVQKNVTQWGKSLNTSGLNMPGMEALKSGALMQPFVDGVKAAMAFETSMAKVRRAVDFQTPDQFKAMSRDVLNLSERLPVSAAGIAQIVALGGKSGIAREELNRFAEDALKMGIAFDQTGEQSGAMMAKWRTDFKLNQTEVVTLADQITQLGRGGDTGKISRIVTAVGPTGLSAGQSAAMGAVLSGAGVSEEAAASGMRKFAQTLSAGTSATEAQQQAFKSLGLDAQAVSKAMSTDAEGTINNVLTKLGAVEKGKQGALLSQLFGDEAVTAVSPLLSNLDALSSNFRRVADSQKYAGSMQEAYAVRSATTESALQLLDNRTARLGIAVGTALLPPFNDFIGTLGSVISKVSEFAEANPGVIRSIAGAAVGFSALRLGIVAVSAAMALMSGILSLSPVGLIVRGIALAAGILIANWSTVAGFFQGVWATIQAAGTVAWEWMKTIFAWSPLGMIIQNWGAITQLFGAIWEAVKALASPFMTFMSGIFDWAPLQRVIELWGPLAATFGAIWNEVTELSAPFMSFLGSIFAWSPMELIKQQWGSVASWFHGLWDEVKTIVEPMMALFGGGLIKSATGQVSQFAADQRKANAGVGGGNGQFLMANAAQQVRDEQAQKNLTQGGASAASLLRPPNQPPAPGSLIMAGSLNQQAAANNQMNLQGGLTVQFQNAPPGTTVSDGRSNQPGFAITPQVGVRTLSK